MNYIGIGLKQVNRPKGDPDGEIDNSGKCIFEIRIPNCCNILPRLGLSKSAATGR